MLEWRQTETKEFGFCVVRDSGSSLVKQAVSDPGGDWWTSLAGVGEGVFFVHSYRSPDIPEPSDLLGFDLSTGTLKWVLPGFRLIGFSDEKKLVVARKEGMTLRYFYCDERDGALLSGCEGLSRAVESDWQEADRYHEGDQYYTLLRQTILETTGLSPVGAIEYLDYADRMVFSFYLYEKDSMVQYVAVLNRFKAVEYLEMVERNLKKEGKFGLLLKEGRVYFVKNRMLFVGINLAI